ncbi:hypothetical protein [Rhodococcus sp. IEGM 1318]|uniref:hypothetical protein n=1 Tax=Rhodococcus sp. IEGM 1318 TaxID=3082226 RepID=UPI002953C207|nr:hypothetical protein [Rhodococcus sp. IEGM 1318]MDV8009511.1 hypothetical protein [Rhodococcus sp. IEGM 1318]
MSTDVVRLDLLLRRRSIVGYSLGMTVYALVIVALYPAFQNETGLDQFTSENSTVAALFGISGSLTSASGWLNANLYANFLPLIILLLTIYTFDGGGDHHTPLSQDAHSLDEPLHLVFF